MIPDLEDGVSDDHSKSNRYHSFDGIDCEGNVKQVVEVFMRLMADPANSNALWDSLKAKLLAAENPRPGVPDALYLVCSHVYYLADLFELHGENDAAAVLMKIEEECC